MKSPSRLASTTLTPPWQLQYSHSRPGCLFDFRFFEEPGAGVGVAEFDSHFLDVIRELATQGMTMVIATHEMGFAREIADRVCFLDGGRIVESGTFEELHRLGGRFTQLTKAQFLPIDA